MTALTLGLICLAPLAIGFGIVALRRVGRTGLAGRGLAIAGIALGGAWLMVIAFGVAIALLLNSTDAVAALEDLVEQGAPP